MPPGCPVTAWDNGAMVAVTQDTSEDTLVTLTMGLDPAGSSARDEPRWHSHA